jgi:hypothetical protein
MAAFFFRSGRGEIVSPIQWVADWASRFDSKKYPEDIYQELIARGPELADADFEVLGAWKDGAIESTPSQGLKFGSCWYSFNNKWSRQQRVAPTRFGEVFQAVARRWLGT